MRKSTEAKWKQDLRDAEAIFDDLVRFSKMTWEEVKAYAEEHSGHLDWLDLEPGRAFHMSRESSDRFWAMTNRQLEVHPSSGDLDRSTLNQAIRYEYGVMIGAGGMLDRSAVDKMLARAVKRASSKHGSKTRYVPCVVVGKVTPHEFKIGPVRFLHRDKFFAEYGEKIERDLAEKSAEQLEEAKRLAQENKKFAMPSDDDWAQTDRMTFDSVTGHYKGHEWIAEITIPPCDERVSLERADLVVQAALDILKIFFGSSYAQIVKYVAALERLSITEKSGELTDTVTRRAALFATQGDPEALPKARADAREFYDWRSALMHGRSSPVARYQLQSYELKSVMYRGEQLLRSALFGALAVYANLIIDGKSTGKDLEKRLRELEVTFGLVKPPGRIARLLASIKRWWRQLFK